MRELRIYGYSDDIVAVRDLTNGALSDEWGYNNCIYIELSTGDVFYVDYTSDGIWRVKQLKCSGCVQTRLELAEMSSEDDAYSDSMFVVGEIDWAEGWESWPPGRRELLERIQHELDDADAGTLAKIWELVCQRRSKVRT